MEPAALNVMWSFAILRDKYFLAQKCLFTGKTAINTFEKVGERFHIVENIRFFLVFQVWHFTSLQKDWLLNSLPFKAWGKGS